MRRKGGEQMRQGETKEEAITNIKEAIRGYIAALEQDKLPVPAT